MKLFSIFHLLCFSFSFTLLAGELSTGVRIQESIAMYNENGITLQYSPSNLLNNQLAFGVSYVSSRLGSAFNSNAILQDNIQLHSTYLFSSSSLSPSISLNAGYCFADYESQIFEEIDASMPLLSIEAGARYAFDFPLTMQAGLGYNLITSDGSSGVGTVYPLFVQCSFLWRFGL